MKKHLKIIIPIVIIFFLAVIGFSWDLYRYHINSPMPDLEYKKAILKKSHNLTYTLEALRPIMGPEELTEFIKNNDSNPQIYTPSIDNRYDGTFRANLHMHTTNSDGKATVQDRFDFAQNYAQKHIKDGYMLIAITDHNTVLGAKEAVRILEKNKGKYDKIRVVPGIEIFTEYKRSEVVNEPVQIHVLTWCINPYDEFLNIEFYKGNLKDKWNRGSQDRDFDWVIRVMADYGIVGVAHPARYTTYMKEKKYPYITEMLTRYSKMNTNTLFTEGYYQSYPVTSTGPHLGAEYDKYINHINAEAKKLGINRTGSTDAHGFDIFGYSSKY